MVFAKDLSYQLKSYKIDYLAQTMSNLLFNFIYLTYTNFPGFHHGWYAIFRYNAVIVMIVIMHN